MFEITEIFLATVHDKFMELGGQMFWVVSNKVISLHLITFNLSSYTGASNESFFQGPAGYCTSEPPSPLENSKYKQSNKSNDHFYYFSWECHESEYTGLSQMETTVMQTITKVTAASVFTKWWILDFTSKFYLWRFSSVHQATANYNESPRSIIRWIL